MRELNSDVAEEFDCCFDFSGVAGGTASGKTTVCNMIIAQLHDQRVVLVNQVRALMPPLNSNVFLPL